MRMGLRLGIGSQGIGTGGGGGGTAPVISGTPLLTDEEISVSGDLPITFYGKTSATSTPLSAAAIEAAPDDTIVLAGGANYLPALNLETTPGTWYYNYFAKNAAGSSAVETESYIIAAPPARVFTETWSGFTAGDTNAQIDAGGYTLGSNPPAVTITADAASPSGKAAYGTGSVTSVRTIQRDDIATDLAVAWTSIEVLVKVRTTSGTGARGGLGLLLAGSLGAGVVVQRAGGGTNIGIARDSAFAAPDQFYASGVADDTIYWVRFQISGGNIRGRGWTDGGGEPGSYGADLAISGSVVARPLALIGTNITPTNFKILGYSIGIDTGAPSF